MRPGRTLHKYASGLRVVHYINMRPGCIFRNGSAEKERARSRKNCTRRWQQRRGAVANMQDCYSGFDADLRFDYILNVLALMCNSG